MQTDESVERRIVTVLFADLVGFTELSERFDAEDVASIQDSYFGAVRETVGRYGGRLEKFIGDAAMAVFGVPRSGDDDVERAVRAGLALTHAVQQIGAQLGLDDDALRLRVGINTGEVVVAAGGEDEGRVTGDTVNTAARLQTAAPPGGVLIGEASALAVADIAEMEPVPPLELKGKAEPTQARLVTGMHPEASREQAMGALRAPMLGREREMRVLNDAWARATAGSVERLLIVAPPGVGKSRLLREMAEQVEAQPSGAEGDASGASITWRSRARPDSLSPFDPISRLMREALSGVGTARQTAESELRARLAAAGTSDLRTDVVVDACLALAWPPATADDARPSDERSALFGAWLGGLDAIAAGRTQVWLIEDVHWVGGDVLAFLDEASTGEPRDSDGRTEQGGRLVIATARPSLLDAQPAWAADDPSAGRTVLHLATLQATDAAGLIEALVGDALPKDLVERIAERSDGNCLFIEELLRTWISVGALAPTTGHEPGWRLTVPAGEIPLPQSVQSIYAAQLDDLPPAARRLARRASVAGRRFPVAALEPLGADAADGLQPLRRRALVDGPVDEPVLGDAFAYRHALLRDAGYASLARAERGRLHVRLARWLEAAAGDRVDEVAEQIAGHYAAALESAPSLAREIDEGVDRDEARRQAAKWYERAGTGTLALSAHDAARQLFRRSIDLTPDDAHFEQARRWERLGDATAFAADMDEGSAAYTKAMELYRQVIGGVGTGFDKGSAALEKASEALARQADWLARISPEGAAAMTSGAAELRAGSNQIQQGKAELQSSLIGARAGLARTASSLADVMYQQLQFEDSRRLAEQVMTELGDESDADSRSRLAVAQAMGALGAGGPSPEVEAQMQRAVELARESGDPRVELRALRSLTVVQSESGDDDPAAWQKVADAAEALGDWVTVVSAMGNGAMAKLDDRATEVFEPIGRARQLAIAHGLTENAGWSDYIECEAAFISGDWDRAMAAGLRAIDLGERNSYLRLTVRTLHVLVPIASVRGDQEMLERAAHWYASLEGKFEFPDSPYARIMRVAQDLELAAAGLVTPFVPDVAPRIASFDDSGGGSWSAALDRVLRSWVEAGELDGADLALAHLGAVVNSPSSSTSSLAYGTYDLMNARVAIARSAPGVAGEAALTALGHFRNSSAPWWMAKAIRLSERAGAADPELVAEVEQIEHRLGAVGPTL